MILVDMTIVTVATPDIMAELDASTNDVLWVTSAYLLAYAVPVLIMGRLGDRVGPSGSTSSVWPSSPLPRWGAASAAASRC